MDLLSELIQDRTASDRRFGRDSSAATVPAGPWLGYAERGGDGRYGNSGLTVCSMRGLLRLAPVVVLCSLAIVAVHAEESTVLPAASEPAQPATDAAEAGAATPPVDIQGLFILPNEQDPNALDPKAPYITASDGGFDWESAISGSFMLLSIQHSVRLGQEKTYTELDGPFFRDYFQSVKGLKGWEDGDNTFTNYLLHPGQGSLTSFIQIQNDPKGRTVGIKDGSAYWKSRLKGLAWSTAYSFQFELGPYSEATIGNVGQIPGTMTWVDLVMTPVGGFVFVLAEDLMDEYLVAPLEKKANRSMKRVLRMVFSPSRTFANILRFKKPWRRDNRTYIPSYARAARLVHEADDD